MSEAPAPIAAARFRHNALLAALASDDAEALAASAGIIAAKRGAVIFEPGEDAAAAFFPCGETLVSLAVRTAEGCFAETALMGRESAVGAVVSNAPAFARAVVQAPGELVRIDTVALQSARARSASLADLLARSADCLVAQLLQTIACNAAHRLEPRMARWLLCISDRYGTGPMPITQDYLSRLLGVGRTYVTRAASGFQDRGLIRYQRGHLTISDVAGLEGAACSCRDAIREHFNRVLPGVYPGAQVVSPDRI